MSSTVQDVERPSFPPSKCHSCSPIVIKPPKVPHFPKAAPRQVGVRVVPSVENVFEKVRFYQVLSDAVCNAADHPRVSPVLVTWLTYNPSKLVLLLRVSGQMLAFVFCFLKELSYK